MTTATSDMMTIDEVQSFLLVSRATIYELMATKGLPRPLKIGRSNRWLRLEVENWRSAQPRADVQVREAEPAEAEPAEAESAMS